MEKRNLHTCNLSIFFSRLYHNIVFFIKLKDATKNVAFCVRMDAFFGMRIEKIFYQYSFFVRCGCTQPWQKKHAESLISCSAMRLLAQDCYVLNICLHFAYKVNVPNQLFWLLFSLRQLFKKKYIELQFFVILLACSSGNRCNHDHSLGKDNLF